MIKNVTLLSDGFFEIDMGFLVYGKYHGIPYKAALKPLLVITNEDRIIIDTGIGEVPGKYKKFYKIKREKDLEQDLKQHGLAPEDISVVINTHLHLDHCGNNRIFRNAKFYVQRDELLYARNPHRFQKGGYIKELFDVAEYTCIEGDVEIVEGVKAVFTPGHTPGHQSVIIDGEHRYVYCGGVAPLWENLKRRNIVGILYNPIQALESIDRLRKIKGKYIYSHDNEQLHL